MKTSSLAQRQTLPSPRYSSWADAFLGPDMFSELLNTGVRGSVSPLQVRSSGMEGSNYILEVYVPGVDPKDVAVQIEGRGVTVTTPDGQLYHTIGQRLASSEAKAKVKWGILRLEIPTREAHKVDIIVEE